MNSLASTFGMEKPWYIILFIVLFAAIKNGIIQSGLLMWNEIEGIIDEIDKAFSVVADIPASKKWLRSDEKLDLL